MVGGERPLLPEILG